MTAQTSPQVVPAFLPIVPANATDKLLESLLEFFKCRIGNDNTRRAFGASLSRFSAWLSERGLAFETVKPSQVADYVRELEASLSVASVKQHLSLVKRFFDHLVLSGIVPFNPSASIKGPRLNRRTGATPYLEKRDVRKLLSSVGRDTPLAKRNYTILVLFLYTACRCNALSGLRVKDYYAVGNRRYLHFREKNGLEHEAVVHPVLQDALDDYLAAVEFAGSADAFLFQALTVGEAGQVWQFNGERLDNHALYQLVKRLATGAGFPAISPHSFRVSAANAFFKADATVEQVQTLLQHRSVSTTRLYLRHETTLGLEEMVKLNY